MEQKTEITAEEDKQEIRIKRVFDLLLALLFKAHVEPEILAQWMGTKVLKLECKRHGSFQFETIDPQGNTHRFNGVIHEMVPNQKITRTFEMEGTAFPVQLEYFEFEKLNDNTSQLNMHIIYKSVAVRDDILKLPFAYGLNMAHNQLQEFASKLK
ncbi:MAG: SRPBCC domain-containing protein [Bacteroidota bacterium]